MRTEMSVTPKFSAVLKAARTITRKAGMYEHHGWEIKAFGEDAYGRGIVTMARRERQADGATESFVEINVDMETSAPRRAHPQARGARLTQQVDYGAKFTKTIRDSVSLVWATPPQYTPQEEDALGAVLGGLIMFEAEPEGFPTCTKCKKRIRSHCHHASESTSCYPQAGHDFSGPYYAAGMPTFWAIREFENLLVGKGPASVKAYRQLERAKVTRPIFYRNRSEKNPALYNEFWRAIIAEILVSGYLDSPLDDNLRGVRAGRVLYRAWRDMSSGEPSEFATNIALADVTGCTDAHKEIFLATYPGKDWGELW